MRPFRLLLLLAVPSSATFATETDQFATPRTPLPDIGPLVSRKVVEVIESDRTGAAPEQILVKWAGGNPFASSIARWVGQLRIDEKAVTFHPGVFASIQRTAFSPIPVSFLFDSPTVNLYGYYMGTDKLDHFFRQGHEYFVLAEKRGVAAAVARGVRQEHTYLGTLASGVYSNADLAANFAGLKFYFNLRQAVRVGDRELPPLFEQSPEGWRLRPAVDPDHILDPFLSHHLDESLNPSRYRFSRASTRAHIRKHCEVWMRFHGTRDIMRETWFGEDYGHWLPASDEISMTTECPAATSDNPPRTSTP